MPDRSDYSRKFIILENDKIQASGKKNSQEKGYAKIETKDGKGKIQFNVEGLEVLTDPNKAYKGYLATKQKDRLIKVDTGIIPVNNKGKGTLEWKFSPKSVDRTGIPIEEFEGIVIKLSNINGKDTVKTVPLAASIHDNKKNIKGLLNEFLKNYGDETFESRGSEEKDTITTDYVQKEDKVEEHSEQLEGIETDFNQVTEEKDKENLDSIVEYEETEQRTSPIDEIEEMEDESIDKTQEEGMYQFIEVEDDDDNPYFIASDEESEESNKNDENYENKNDYNPPVHDYGYSFNTKQDHRESVKSYSHQVAEYCKNILRYFEKADPVKEGPKGYTWWKIDFDSKNVYRGFLPFYHYVVSTHQSYPVIGKTATSQSLIKKYEHYVFGIVEENEDIKYYVYGIPGMFTKEEQPYRGLTGFQTWFDKKGRERYGYWLMHIDAITGKVVSPLKATSPRRHR